ncbi:DNA-binding response regulator [Winogradskyella aquimaris]|uniref:Response regulator n=1 Tax=Winogradskyella aquimaris TaxID=864074 RepID=A0ABU5ER46_9FLAO|nr:response regulator [Winogradskyella aquimaris]MDY2588195.1 response regulator [Winogradskyella aquimaris]
MFKRVLINDDHDAIVESVAQILDSTDVSEIAKTHYCDEAYLKLKKAQLDQNPFDLIITDLSFKIDHRTVELVNGEDLIAKIRQDFPDMAIIVYSMKDQIQKVRTLVKKFHINAYVCKDRKGLKELSEALKIASSNKIYLSPQVSKALHPKSKMEIDDFDIRLISLLARGYSQDEISTDLKEQNISPNSLSTIEKRLNKLKIQFRANNTIHLVAIAKDLGLI